MCFLPVSHFKTKRMMYSTVDSGTQKPGVKGRRMYQSFKLQMAEFGMNTRKDLIFRANCDASLKKQELRYPRVVISPQGAILEATCVCPANADGRCAHVATLLYLIEDVSYKNTPKLLLPSTSVPQYWGKGKTRDNNPKLHMKPSILKSGKWIGTINLTLAG